MSWSGTVFQPLSPPYFPAVSGTTISSSYFNAVINDLIGGFNQFPTTSGAGLIGSTMGITVQAFMSASPQRYSTKAGLQAVSTSSFSYAFVDGTDGGWFVRNPSDLASAEDGGSYCGTIIRSSDYATNGVWRRVYSGNLDPAWYGVVGSGDEGANIAAMITAASTLKKVIQLHEGTTYQTSTNLVINASTCPAGIIGRNSTIKATGSITGNLFKVENPHSKFSGFKLSGINFDANNKCSGALYIHGSQGCVYEDLNAYNAKGAVSTSDGIGVNIVGEPGYGVYYNEFRNIKAGKQNSSNGGSGYSLKSINNSGGFYIADNDWHGCKSQWNNGFGWDIDYCSDGGAVMSAECNDLPGFNVNNTYSLTYTGGYSENNNVNWSANGGSATTSVTVSSVSGSGTTATVTATAHGLQTGQVITMSGSADAAYNTLPGTAVYITVTDANTFTYTTQSAISSGSPAGSFVCTLADTSFILRSGTSTSPSVSLGVVVMGGRHIGNGYNFNPKRNCFYLPANYTQALGAFIGSDEFGNVNITHESTDVTSVAYAATLDLSSLLYTRNIRITSLTGNLTISALPDVTRMGGRGLSITMTFPQDATGSRTVTFPAGTALAGGTFTTSGANKVDKITLHYDPQVPRWEEVSRAMNQS